MNDNHHTNSTLLSQPSSLKRKRMEEKDISHDDDNHQCQKQQQRRQVRFDDQATQIVTTYSSEEYDRGGIFSFPVLYKVNPSILQQQQQQQVSPPKLSLDTQLHPSLGDEKQSPQTPLEESPTTPPGSNKRPKLTINTTNLTDGPAFLTRLSTTHNPLNDNDKNNNDYLVPLSAYAPPSFLPFF